MGPRWWMLGFALVCACEQGGDAVDKDKTKGDEKKSAQSAKPSATGSAKPAAAEPKAAEPSPAPAADSGAPAASGSGSNAAEPAPAATCGPPKEVPVIPDTESNPPTLEEWKNGCDINTQGANSEATDCTMKLLREWLQVTCHGDIVRHEEMKEFGAEGKDYFQQVGGKVASFVVRLKKHKNPKVRICRTDDRASLFVSWPPGKDRPTIIALGRGQKCD